VKHLRPPWRPGESGNPLGVNRGVFALAAEIRRQTGQGQLLVEFYLDLFAGRPIPVPGGRAQRPTLEHRHLAAQWLADRGWGKAKEIIELTGDAPATPEQRLALLRRLSDDERATLRGLLAKALATPEADPSDPRAASDLEPEDPPADGAAPREAGAPATLGRPRNVGRALAPELPDPGAESPADPPADGPSATPTGPE
jgi:hypothetical protein